MKPIYVSALVIFGLACYAGRGVYSRVSQAAANIQAQLTEQRKVQELREQVAASLQQVEQMEQRLAPEPETEWLIRQVNRIAQETGTQLSAIVPQAPKSLQAFVHLTVALQLTASYHQVGRLLSALESSPSFIRVEQLEVTRKPETAVAQVQLLVGTLYVPPLVPGRETSR